MIQGDLRFAPNAPPNQPPWCAMPWVDVEIKIPSLSIESTFTLMADTGATSTVLNIRDAWPILGKRGYRLLRQASRMGDSIGVGGAATYYITPAKLIFEHDDGTLESHDFILAIAKPAKKGSKKLANQFRLPSLLGRDNLSHFRMVMDYSRNQMFLDHN
jgi:hypothetical protein